MDMTGVTITPYMACSAHAVQCLGEQGDLPFFTNITIRPLISKMQLIYIFHKRHPEYTTTLDFSGIFSID